MYVKLKHSIIVVTGQFVQIKMEPFEDHMHIFQIIIDIWQYSETSHKKAAWETSVLHNIMQNGGWEIFGELVT